MRKWLAILAILGFAGLGIFWWLSAPKLAVATPNPSLEQGGDKENGRIIFFAGGCASCHATPGQEDRLKLGGGYAMPSPFGTFYAPNISPHPQDGIGKWSVADLANALKAGMAPDGSHYFPAFPYTSYAKMRIEDVKDLMAFMRTLEPVAGKARAHDVGFPFNIRRTLGMWKLMFFDTKPLAAVSNTPPAVQRGEYLVEALSHCAECHSPRNALGGIVSGRRFSGGPDPSGKAWNPNISQHAKALGEWTAKDVAGFLKTGFNMEGDVVGGSMGSVIKNMAELPEADLLAMGDYLKSLPALEPTPKPAAPAK
jgi:mono/diheme cytochrome c family protein